LISIYFRLITPEKAPKQGEPPLKPRTFAFLIVLVVTTFSALNLKAAPAPSQDWKALYQKWKYPDPLPNFTLTNQEGKEVPLYDLKGSYVLFSFIFTRCAVQTACPLTTTKMRDLQTKWNALPTEKRKGKKLWLASISFDPTHDTPAVLKGYAKSRKADFSNWSFFTGPVGLVDNALPSLFNVIAFPSEETLSHNVKLALVDPDLKDIKSWPDNEFKPEDVIAEILKHEFKAAQ